MFFLLNLGMNVLFIYILAALLPAIILMRYIYSKDTYEKEPASLLWSCVLNGVLAALVSIILEMIGTSIVGSFVDQNSETYSIVTAFLVVAVVEEGTKFFFNYRRTWRDPNFNYTFDAIVYSTFTSLGFAAFENIEYVFQYGLSVALPRAVLSVPGHCGFAVVFGYFYGRAKTAELNGDTSGRTANLIAGYVSAVLLHGFYDSCAMINTATSNVLFVISVVVMYIVIIHLIRKESRDNTYV